MSSEENSDLEPEFGAQGYQYEPEYIEEEIIRQSNSAAKDEHERSHDLTWCHCGQCIIMPSRRETSCCQEFEHYVVDYISESMQGTTQHHDFELSTLSGHATLKNVTLNNQVITQPPPLVDKLVIILIDALRADFILGDEKRSMPHITKMINDRKGVAFEVRAHPPTVTLPRIKAITTGTIPEFIDVVLNFDSSSLEEDNLVAQMRLARKQMVFYGDDTWLKLFPNHFVRSDGTTSFFVTDYTEVDNNVTRHLDSELSSFDWNLMILHYLGLDHIGHLQGPFSPLVAPKLQEMDEIINRIYTALESQSERSLILVCGDHGMSDHGGHGGASDKETLVPALFLSPLFKNTEHLTSRKGSRSQLQIDLAPTLSVLLGLPIPNNNLGQVLQDVLEHRGMKIEKILDILYINSLQIVQLMEANIATYKSERSYQMFLDTVSLHREFLSRPGKSETDMKQLLYLYETTLEALTDRISSSLTEYDIYQLVTAPVVMLVTFISLLLMMTKAGNFLPPLLKLNISLTIPAAVYVLWYMLACSSANFYSKTMCGFSIVSLGVHCGLLVMLTVAVASVRAILGITSRSSKEWYPNSLLTRFLLAGSLMHSLTYISSSNIEEEHQTCYFLATTFFLLNIIQTVLSFSQHTYKQKFLLKAAVQDHSKHIKTRTCACGEATYKEVPDKRNCGVCVEDSDVVKKPYSEILYDTNSSMNQNKSKIFQSPNSKETSLSENSTDTGSKDEAKINFPTGKLMSSLTVLVLLRFLRSLNQTGNKWLDRPDIGDWLNRPEHKLILSIVVLLALLALWATVARKYSFTEVMMVGLALLSCYRYRAKTGVIEDFLNQITTVDKKYIGTIQFLIIYGIGLLLIIRNVMKWVTMKLTKTCDEELKTNIVISIIESVQHAYILMLVILLRTHNILYVLGLGLIEMLMVEQIPALTALPVPYLTMVCLWLGRAAFFYQGNSNSLSSIDVAAGYAGLPHYESTIVTIQLSLTTYAGPIFWFIILLKYIYLKSLHCDTETESQSARLRRHLSQSVLTLVLERLFTLLLYTTVTTVERYHLFVWTVFSPKLLYEGMYTLLSAIVNLIFVSLM